MTMKFKAAVGSLLIGAAVAGAAVVPASGQAAQPGQVCNVDTAYAGGAAVVNVTTGNVMYYVPPGGGFRIVAYSGGDYLGHGNGLPDGLMLRLFINQASCHW